MKRLALLVVVLLALVSALPAMAQNANDLITLNDASPVIDVVITLPPDTTGTIALDFSGAAITLTDGSGSAVFTAADPRLHGLQLNIAPNSGSHTLRVERLLGVTNASVRVVSLPELTQSGLTQLVTAPALQLNQEVSLPLSTDRPGDMVAVSIPAETTGVITATFPGVSAITQLVDEGGLVMAQSNGAHVDGLNFVIDSGNYQFTLLGSNLTTPMVAGVRAVSAAEAGFIVLASPVSAAAVADTTAPAAPSAATCTATVSASSLNLRSGPGTGYTILGYGYRGQVYTVGGQNPENNWMVVGTDFGSAWVSRSFLQTQGECTQLTVFNIPLKDAVPAQIVFAAPAQSAQQVIVAPAQSAGGTFNGEYEGGEHEGGDDDGGEHEDGDD
jgi:uncharacterized protein YraI